jgi:hypothetical protein
MPLLLFIFYFLPSTQSTIFSMDLDPSSQHTLTVYNLANNGEITFGHLAVEIDDVAPGNYLLPPTCSADMITFTASTFCIRYALTSNQCVQL